MSILFSEKAWGKVCALVAHNKEEVGWFGVTKKVSNTEVEVVDIFVPDQGVDPTEWVAAKEAMADMQLEDEVLDLLEEGYKLNYMGHSHVSMGVGASAQDEAYIDFLLEDAPEMDYVLYTTIHNKRLEVSGQASLMVTGLGRMSTDISITYTQSSYQAWAKEQTAKRVTKLVPAESNSPNKGAYDPYDGRTGYPSNNTYGNKHGNKKGGIQYGSVRPTGKDWDKLTPHQKQYWNGFKQQGKQINGAQTSLSDFSEWARDEATEWRDQIKRLESDT